MKEASCGLWRWYLAYNFPGNNVQYGIKSTVKPISSHARVMGLDTFNKRARWLKVIP